MKELYISWPDATELLPARGLRMLIRDSSPPNSISYKSVPRRTFYSPFSYISLSSFTFPG